MAALSGPLSKRRLGTRSGELRRLARQAERDGADGAANQLYFAAAQAKLGEGSAISSAEGNIATADLERRASQGLAQTKMDLLTGRTTAATGGLLAARQKLFEDAKAAGGFSDELKNRGRELGVTDSGLALAQSRLPVRGGSPAANPGTPGSVAGNPAATAYNPAKPDGDGNGIPDLIQRPSLKETKPAPAPVREGRINGMPASQAIAQSRESLRQGGPRQAYGKDIATKNVETLGLDGAIADYRRRSALEAGRDKRGADYRAAEEAPGNLREGIPIVGPAKPGPLTMAVNDAMTRKRLDAAGSAAMAGPPTSAMSVPQVGPPASAMSVPQVGPPASAMPIPEVGPPASAMNPIVGRRRLIDARNTGVQNPSNVTFESPLAAVRDRYKLEENQKLKTPLRSAWLAAGSGLAAAGRNLTQTY